MLHRFGFGTIRGLGLTFALALAGAAVAQAQDDIEAKAKTCNGCHGQNGVPVDAKTIPNIWGQQTYYIVKELTDYRSGERDNAIMGPIAKGLAGSDLRPIAKYFAAEKAPANASTATVPAPAAEKIATCKICHQPHFEGGLPAPRLAGMNADYLLAQMNAFADGTRTNNGDMPALMKALSPADREQIAHYLASL